MPVLRNSTHHHPAIQPFLGRCFALLQVYRIKSFPSHQRGCHDPWGMWQQPLVPLLLLLLLSAQQELGCPVWQGLPAPCPLQGCN